MVVTKQGLVKVIALLVIIDLIAAFWYVSLRIENSGESRDLFEKMDSVAENADTIAETTRPDTFDIIEAHGYFVSQQPVVTGNSNTHLASIKTIKMRVPQSINGNDSINTLHEALMEKAFGHHSYDYEYAINSYTSKPWFPDNSTVPFKPVNYVPNVDEAFCNNSRIVVYPIYTSHRILVYEIDHKRKESGRTYATSAYVHYDRVNYQVIKRSDIINIAAENDILALINKKIAVLTSEKKINLLSASKVPYEVCVKQSGISFIFTPGEIAPISEGEIEIHLPYKAIRGMLNPNFLPIIDASTGWWSYKQVK